MGSYRSPLPPRGAYTYPATALGVAEARPSGRWQLVAAIVAFAAVVLMGLVWTLTHIQHQCCSDSHGVIVVEVNGPDATSANNGLELAKPVIDQKASALAATGGGTIYFLRTDGNKAQQIDTVDLQVTAPDGSPETDDETRARVIADRIAAAASTTQAAPATSPGRAFLPLQAMAAQLAPKAGQPFDIIYVGFGLGDTDPLDARKQIAGMDPSQSVDSVQNQLADTPDAVYTLVFTAAAGPQPALNTTTRRWRTAWFTDMAAATGASIGDVIDQNIPAAPPSSAPEAAVIPNIPEVTTPGTTPPTATPPPTSTETVLPPADPAPAVLAGALFQPDSPDWVDQQQAALLLQPLADAWKANPGGYQPLSCTGRTAQYGDPQGAVVLSLQRSAQALALAHQLGIEQTTDPDGRGYNDPLPSYSPSDPAQRSVTCLLTPKK